MGILRRKEFGSPDQWSGRDKSQIFACLSEVAFSDPETALACIDVWARSPMPASRMMAAFLICQLDTFRAIGEPIPQPSSELVELLANDPHPSVNYFIATPQQPTQA